MTVVISAFQKRRLAKALIMLSKQACDEKDFAVASSILHITERFVLSSFIDLNEKRSIIVSLVEGYELLWSQRNSKLAPEQKM